MIENNLLTVISDKVLEYPDEFGARHADKLKQACLDLNLNTDKTSEFELATFLSAHKNIAIMNSYGAALLFVPENLSEIQTNFLVNNKEKFYKREEKGDIIEIVISTEKPVDYNRNQLYRTLSIEQQIASLEGKPFKSQLDILYEEVENQKANIK